MEHITIKVESIQPALRKDKTKVEGMGRNGVHWQLFKINMKYSYFYHGEEEPDFILGKEYPFDLETKQEGQFTNYQIFIPKKSNGGNPGETKSENEITKGLRELWKQNEEIKKLLKMILDK